MREHLRFLLIVMFMPLLAACGQVIPATGEAAPTGQPTGVAQVDQVLAAVASGDPSSLRALAEFFEAPCTNADGLGGPPKCRAGEAEGTPVEVIAFLGGEGGHFRRDEIDNWNVNATGVYAVYRVNTAVISSEQYYPVGEYVVLLLGENDSPATALRIGERGIVRVDTIFDASPENLDAMIEREAADVLLGPIR